MVADALSRKSSGSLAHISIERRPLIQELHELVDQGLIMKISRSGGLFNFKSDQCKGIGLRQPKAEILFWLNFKRMSNKKNSLILHLMMKVFCGSVEGYVFLMWII